MAKKIVSLDKATELYAKVQAKKLAIEGAEKSTYQTDGYFRFSANGQIIDLKAVRSKSQLVDALAFLYERQSSHKKAADFLGVEIEETWLGAPISSWEHDLKIRMTQLNLAAERAQLAEIESKLKQLNPDLLAKLELDAIEAALK